jgi:diguanylate cyclase (GGDEF)-like protein
MARNNDKRLRFAVLMDHAFSTFQEEARLGSDRYAKEAGIDLIYFGVGALNPSNKEDMMRAGFLDMIGPGEFDGILAMTTSLVNQGGAGVLEAKLKAMGPLPIVSVGHSAIGEDCLVYDSASGIAAIMRHLLRDHGFRDLAFVSGPLSNAEACERLDAYHESLAEAGVAYREEAVYEGNFVPSSGAAAVASLYDERGLRPQAIVCANDLMALGAWNALLERGLKVPFDVAVTGFDDSQFSRALSHRFTTARQSFSDLGYLACGRLHALARGESPPPPEPLIPELRIRGSCGCMGFERRGVAQERKRGLERRRAAPEIAALQEAMAARGTDGTCESWYGIVHESLVSRRPIYELEEALMDWIEGEPRCSEALVREKLYSLLLEECGQLAYADYWGERINSMRLRMAMGALQQAVKVDLRYDTHADAIDAVAGSLGAKSFYLAGFNDVHDIGKGALSVFSKGLQGEWKPAPGAWFPPRGASLVANMLGIEDDRYGYMLVDEGIEMSSSFDLLRIQFSGIIRDLLSMLEFKSLNDELRKEIQAREETEGRLKSALALVERLSVEDELTHLHNRRGFLAAAEQQMRFLRRQGMGFSILYADLDGLKAINDRYGHLEGDTAIRAAGEALSGALRESDIVARLGGDEFTAFVSDMDPPDGAGIRRRIEARCEAKNAELKRPWRLSMSIGFYHAPIECELSLPEMLDLADAELYKEKQRKKAMAGLA